MKGRISRADHPAEALRGVAAKSQDGAQVRRPLALAPIREGHPRHTAAERSGMERQTRRERAASLQRCGRGGPSVDPDQRTPGPAPMAASKAPTIKAPAPETDSVVRRRCVDPCAAMARRFTVGAATMGRRPRRAGPFRRERDGVARAACRDISPAW